MPLVANRKVRNMQQKPTFLLSLCHCLSSLALYPLLHFPHMFNSQTLFVVGWTSGLREWGGGGMRGRAGWVVGYGRHMLAFTHGRLPARASYLFLEMFEMGRLLVYCAAFHLICAYLCNPSL